MLEWELHGPGWFGIAVGLGVGVGLAFLALGHPSEQIGDEGSKVDEAHGQAAA